ncbi:MAG: tellurite resistance TerB C-terminal domain-containing protein [Aeromonadales bacterium]|nr:tellurite resistance TerB C-terminal domain-containing protein [Aeromonadales bacterium]MDY2890907.1 tellurite resistance TerB C-terminal domain-containing protein [Succinivibrio sp.]
MEAKREGAREGRRDASYFLKHMNNLPEPRAHALRELEAECASRRMLSLAVADVVKRLGLETSEQDYLEDPLSQLSALRRYLLAARVSFAPCGNPADVAFGDPLFLTPMPVLTNDEDISAVARLARSGRAPSASDFGAISRTTAKMNSYNVMLRVFENLCAVRSGQLGAAQLDVLNRILGSLELPLEGENYLRVCLSYASQVGVKHCDYTRPGTLYPQLSEPLMDQVEHCLARVCSASSYPQPIDQRYMRFDKLSMKCALSVREARQEAASDPDELERQATMSFNRSRISTATRRNAQAASANQMRPLQSGALFSKVDLSITPGATGDKLREARGRISMIERLKLSIPAVRSNLRDRLRYAEGKLMQGLPMPGKIFVERSPLNPARLVIRGDAAEGALLSFGIIPRGMDPIEYSKRDPRPWGLSQYFGGQESATPAEHEALRAITTSTLFYALIAAPLLSGSSAFIGVSMDEIADAAADKFAKSLCLQGMQRPELGALYALHRTLIAPKALEDEASDMALMRALLICPGVLNAYVQDRIFRAGGIEKLPESLRVPCMLAGLSEILRTSKPMRHLLSSAPGRPEFFSYCQKAFADAGYFDGAFSLEQGPERRLDFEGVPEMLLRLGRIPLAAFIMNEITSRRGFNDLSGQCFRVDPVFESAMEKELRSRQDALDYLSSTPPSAPSTVSAALLGSLTRAQAQALRREIAQSGAVDGDQLRLGGALRGSERVLGTLFEEAGMLSVPDPMLPREIPRTLRWSSYCPVDSSLMADAEARERIAAAQCALFMFMTIAPASHRSAALMPMLDIPGEDLPALAKAFEDFENHCRSLTPKTPGQIRAMNLRRLGSAFNGFFQRCLKKLVSIEMAHSVFASYERSRFDEMLGSLGIREAVLPPAGGRRGASAFDSLDKDVIKKRVSETREVEAVITRIREEEEGLGGEAAETARQPAPATGQKPAAAKAAAPAKAPWDKGAGQSSLPGLSAQALELFKSVAAQNADAIDEKEFEGLCRSHGYMSGDAAIEELNGWCFDNLDEGVFEAAPEDGCVYVSTDILSRIVKP